MGSSTAGGSTVYPFGMVRPNSAQTLVSVLFQNKAAGATIYTVPAGKTFYLFGLLMQSAAGISGINLTSGDIGTTTTTAISISSSVPIGYAVAGSVVTCLSYVNGNNGSIWGFIE